MRGVYPENDVSHTLNDTQRGDSGEKQVDMTFARLQLGIKLEINVETDLPVP